jgi:hypothetical protein
MYASSETLCISDFVMRTLQMIIVTGIGKNIQHMLKVKIYKFIKSRYTVRSFKFIIIWAGYDFKSRLATPPTLWPELSKWHFDLNCQSDTLTWIVNVTLQNWTEIMNRRVNSCIQAGFSIQLLTRSWIFFVEFWSVTLTNQIKMSAMLPI